MGSVEQEIEYWLPPLSISQGISCYLNQDRQGVSKYCVTRSREEMWAHENRDTGGRLVGSVEQEIDTGIDRKRYLALETSC